MEENEMVCQDCGAKFGSKEELDQHNMNSGHGGEMQQPGESTPGQMPPEMPGDENGQADEGMSDQGQRGAM